MSQILNPYSLDCVGMCFVPCLSFINLFFYSGFSLIALAEICGVPRNFSFTFTQVSEFSRTWSFLFNVRRPDLTWKAAWVFGLGGVIATPVRFTQMEEVYVRYEEADFAMDSRFAAVYAIMCGLSRDSASETPGPQLVIPAPQ